jgi:hypothetical protein
VAEGVAKKVAVGALEGAVEGAVFHEGTNAEKNSVYEWNGRSSDSGFYTGMSAALTQR